jgi:MoaA/NifB/PqqE/SkfB family radical SAM enzyme
MQKIRSVGSYAKKIVKREIYSRQNKLRQLSLSITQRCNLRCKMCPWWEEGRDSAQLPEEVWLRVVDEAAAEGVQSIGVTGGEPSLHPGFEALLRRIRHHDIKLTLTTNGVTLEHFTPLYAETVDELNISMDAPDELHDEIRGLEGLSGRLFKNIAHLREYTREHGSKRPRLTLHMTVMRENVHKIAKMVSVADEVGADVVSFQYLSCIPQEVVDATVVDGKNAGTTAFTGESCNSMLLDEDGIRVFREQIASLPKTKNCLVIVDPLRRLSDKSLLTGIYPVKRCTLLTNRLVVTPAGETQLCANLTYTMGNVQEMSISEIWNGRARQALVKSLRKKLLPVCANCCSLGSMLTIGQICKVALGREL